MPKLSIVIVTYNSADLIGYSLSSVFKHIHKYQPEVIAVDNNSSDDTVKIIKERFPEVKLIVNDSNRGFAKAANQGWKAAKGEYILFLNPDAILVTHTVERLVEFLEQHKKVGLVGAQLIGLDRLPQASFGNFPGYWTEFFHALAGHKILPFGRYFPYAGLNKSQYRPAAADWVSGGGMLARKELLSRLKGFDEKFFLYLEDVDLCVRARKLGFSSYYLPSAKIIHVQLVSSGGDKAKVRQFEEESLVCYFKKYGKSEVVLKALLKIKELLRGTVKR